MAKQQLQRQQLTLQETSFLSQSQMSIGNYSHYSVGIASNRKDEAGCESCMTRIPYATLIATIMCILGVVVFCGTMYRGATLAVLMFDQVFRLRIFWIEAVQMTFVVIGACMGALGLMILTVGCLATGATRVKVYRAWSTRVGGRISCAVFMGITYLLELAWITMFIFLVIVTFIFNVFWSMCDNPRVTQRNENCIDFTQFSFFFPKDHKIEHMKVCENDIKLFCKDYVEKAEVMFIIASAACILIILSLVHYLMCLAANYAHIRDHEKLQDLQELQYYGDTDTLGGKDRF